VTFRPRIPAVLGAASWRLDRRGCGL